MQNKKVRPVDKAQTQTKLQSCTTSKYPAKQCKQMQLCALLHTLCCSNYRVYEGIKHAPWKRRQLKNADKVLPPLCKTHSKLPPSPSPLLSGVKVHGKPSLSRISTPPRLPPHSVTGCKRECVRPFLIDLFAAVGNFFASPFKKQFANISGEIGTNFYRCRQEKKQEQ